MFIISIQVSFYVFLFPSWLISNSKKEASSERMEQLNKSKLLSDTGSTKLIISNLNKQLNIIDKSLEYPVLIKYINSIISVKTNSIKINSFQYASVSSSTATLNIKGVSSTRDSLVEFKGDLDKLKIFRNIDLPISNYAEEKNIKFNITLNI